VKKSLARQFCRTGLFFQLFRLRKFFATFPYYGKFSGNVSGATDSPAIDGSRPVFVGQLLRGHRACVQ
jgi:hypothetical protein